MFKSRSFIVAAVLAAVVLPPRASHAVTCAGNDVCAHNANQQVIGAPKVFLVLWGLTAMTDTGHDIPNMENLLAAHAAGGSAATWKWFRISNQYTGFEAGGSTSVGAGHAAAQFNVGTSVWTDTVNSPPPDTADAAAHWTDSYIVPEATRAIAHFGISSSDPDAIVIVATGPRTIFPPGYCGRHGSTQPTGFTVPIAYIDMLYQPSIVGGGGGCYSEADGMHADALAHSNLVLQHELQETYTDPRYDTVSWAYADTSGAEVGDKCGGAPSVIKMKLLNDTFTPNTFAITPIWSNALADQFSPPPANGSANGCPYANTEVNLKFWVDFDSGLLYTNNGSWGAYSSWGGPTGGLSGIGSVATVSWQPNRIDLFSTGNDGHLWRITSDDGGATRSAWSDMGAAPAGGTWVGGPTVSSWGPNHLDLFAVVSVSSVRTLYHRSLNLNSNGTNVDSGWASWGRPTNGNITAPAAVSPRPNRLDVFVTDSGTNPRSLAHVAWEAGVITTPTWDSWGAPSGATLGFTGVGVASWGPTRYDVFVPDLSGNLQHRYSDTGLNGWDNWGHDPNGTVSGVPSVIAPGTNQLKITVWRADGDLSQLVERTWNGKDMGWRDLAIDFDSAAVGGVVW